MSKNPMADGPIGTMHGRMHELVRNPFKDDFMRRNYEAAIKTYDSMHKNFIYPGGRRCVGNGWANNFWRGFDGLVGGRWDASSKKTPAYAMYRAGQDIRAAISKTEQAA